MALGLKLQTFAETIANIGVVIVTTPFVLFFMLKDGHHFKEFSTNIMPPKFRKDFHDLLEKMSVQVGSYIQGQIIVSFCIGILLFIGYSVIGLKYSLVLASIAAVTSVVPYFRAYYSDFSSYCNSCYNIAVDALKISSSMDFSTIC